MSAAAGALVGVRIGDEIHVRQAPYARFAAPKDYRARVIRVGRGYVTAKRDDQPWPNEVRFAIVTGIAAGTGSGGVPWARAWRSEAERDAYMRLEELRQQAQRAIYRARTGAAVERLTLEQLEQLIALLEPLPPGEVPTNGR